VTKNSTKHGGEDYGLGIYFANQSGETLRLVLDDLIADPDGEGYAWRRRSFFTHIDLPAEHARSHQLDQDQYKAIGEAVMARLIALLEVASTR
jgi:hypothetical protein